MRFFLAAIFSIFVLSLVGFFLVLNFLPPKINGQLVQINLIYFFSSLWLSLALGSSLVLYSALLASQRLFKKTAPRTENNRPRILLRISLRRGILFASLISLLGALRLFGIFNVLNLALLVGIFALFEAYLENR